MREPPLGEPLAAGTEASLAVAYRPGTVSRYVVEDRQGVVDRSTGAVNFLRRFLYVTTQVLAVEPGGEARVQLTVDAVRDQAQLATGQVWDYDSRNPYPDTLDDPLVARWLRPQLALIGIPVELRVSPSGALVGVGGVAAWTDAFLTELEQVDTTAARGGAGAPNERRVLEAWSLYLFPPHGAGTLAAGREREVRLSEELLERWGVAWAARLRATHADDETVRLEAFATPTLEERGGTSRDPTLAAIQAVRVLASRDAWHAVWKFERDPGRLLYGRVEMTYQVHAAERPTPDPRGGPGTPNARFSELKREVIVDIVR